MTSQEKLCLAKTVELFNALNDLSKEHAEGGAPNDMFEIMIHINAIQNYIFAREGLREYRKTESK
jgi:hypothetical protein